MSPPAHAPVLSWESTPLRSLARLAAPIVVSSLSAATMTVVDTLFVGWLGSWALAGVGLAVTLTLVPLVAGMGLLTGVKTLVAQTRGAGQGSRTASYLGAGFGLAVVFSLAVWAVVALFWHVIPRLADGALSLEAARTYLLWRGAHLTLLLFVLALREFRQGHGDTRSPMRAGVAANIANAVLDYAFVIVMGWGVFGAGLATFIAFGIDFAILAWVQSRSGGIDWRVRRRPFLQALRLGGPVGIEWAVSVGSFVAMATIVALSGTAHMAAHQLCLQVIHFGFLPAMAVAEAASILTGEAVGAGKTHWVRPLAHRAMVLLWGYAGIMTVVFVGAGDVLASGFTKDAEVIAIASQLFVMAGVWQLADAVVFACRGVLRGTGDVWFQTWAGAGISWVIVPPVAWVFGYKMGYGAVAGWAGLALQCLVQAAVLYGRLHQDGWQRAAQNAHQRLAAARDTA